MSCAPFLIALSSSGNRHDSVSRESSVHSMISSSSPLMKSLFPLVASLPFNAQGSMPNAQWPMKIGTQMLPHGFQRGGDAREIGRFVGIARAIPFRHLAEWTERPRAVGGPVRHVPRLDALRRGAGLDPLFHRAHAIEIVGARTALAMIHAGYHVELNRRSNARAALRGDDLLEEVHRVVRRDLRIRPAVIQQQLATAAEERPQVR